MKKIFIETYCLILSFVLVACGSHLADLSRSIYSDFTVKGEGDEYVISGKSHVVNALHLAYISVSEDTSVDLSGELKSISGDVKIVYINPDNKVTVISDSSKDSKERKLKLNTTVNLEKGENRLEFRGEKSTFKFKLLFTNMDEDKIEYFSTDKEDSKFDNENFEDENHKSEGNNIHIEDDHKLLDEVSVTYKNKGDDCIILNTTLKQDTKIKVLVDASITNINDNNNLYFDGFQLAYNTEDNKTIEVLKYKTNEFAIGGYEWQNNFVQELVLPKGTNKLVFSNYDGKNCEINLNIQIVETD